MGGARLSPGFVCAGTRSVGSTWPSATILIVLMPESSEDDKSIVLGRIDCDGTEDDNGLDMGFSRKLYRLGDEVRRNKF